MQNLTKYYEVFCKKWLAAWTGNKPEYLRSFYSEDAHYRDPVMSIGISGAELLPYFTKLLSRNPDWHWEAVEILPTPKGFCLKWKASIPTAGKNVEVMGLDIVEIQNEKITRNEVYFDRTVFTDRS
jgi:hypothetical protein